LVAKAAGEQAIAVAIARALSLNLLFCIMLLSSGMGSGMFKSSALSSDTPASNLKNLLLHFANNQHSAAEA
jgi:hypothetical protein